MDFGLLRKKDDNTIINDAKEDFVDNVLDYLKETSKENNLIEGVMDFVKRTNSLKDQYGSIVKNTLHCASKEFFVYDGTACVLLGYRNNNIENAEKCIREILHDLPEEVHPTYRYVIFFTKSYLETVVRNFSQEFDKKIVGKNVPASLPDVFWNYMDFYQSWYSLKQTENIVHIENFARKYVDVGFSSDNISKLNQLLQHTGLEINPNIVTKIIEQLQLYIKRDRLDDRIRETDPQTLSDYLSQYFKMHGENYLQYVDALEELLKKNNISYEGKIRTVVEEFKKNLEMNKYAESLREPIKRSSYSIQTIDQMDGWQFEEFLKELFIKMGYEVQVTKGSGDQGADLVISKMGEKTVVQAEQYSHKVPNDAVQEITAAIRHYKAYQGMVVASNDFQPSAIELARSNNIQLINREQLSNLIQKYM